MKKHQRLWEGQMSRTTRFAVTLVVSVSSAALTAATVAEPAWADDNRVLHTHYDGVTNDLLTAGLGALGLQGSSPTVSNPPCDGWRSTTITAPSSIYRHMAGSRFYTGPT